MAFDAASENSVQIVWWIGVAINIFAILMMLQVLAFRGIVVWRQRKRRRVERFWQPILLETVASIPRLRVPRLKPAEAYEFLTVWNCLYESLHDTSGERLNETARSAGADVAARRFLKKTNVRQRLMAVTALGNMRDKESWDALDELAGQSEDAVLSFAAAQALMQIDAERAIKIVMPLVASRTNWAVEAVSTMFDNAGKDVISLPLAKAAIVACRTADIKPDTDAVAQHAPRLVYLMRLAHPRFVTYVVRYVLLTVNDLEVIAAALKIYTDPSILIEVRKLLSDERWQIRVNAANAIGRTGGTADDEALLIGALRDKEWWVRYRSAQALASLQSVTLEKLTEYASTQMDDFARDILRQVIAEKKVA